jgi:hypothetical protein
MDAKIRPTMVVDEKPLCVWDDVEGSFSYKLKLAKKESPQNIIWELEVNKSDLLYEGSKLLQFDYPEYEQLSALEELESYCIFGEAYCKQGQMIARAQGELILLEKTTRDVFNSLVDLIREIPDDNAIKDLFGKYSNHLFMNNKTSAQSLWNFFGRPCYATFSSWESTTL